MADRLPPLAAWQALRSLEAAQRACATIEASDVAAVSRLRRSWPAEVVAAGLCLAEGRARLREKFPDATSLWADSEAAQQASSALAAAWKATRFAAVDGPVDDLCCGMGGDAMALGRVAEVRAVDRSEVRAWMAGLNAGCATLAADVIGVAPHRHVHIDPARREEGAGRRRHELEAMEPPLSAVLALARGASGAAVKLSPGIPMPFVDASDAEIEFLSENGRLVQAVAWFGDLAGSPGGRTASIVTCGLSVRGEPAPARVADALDLSTSRFLYVPDPALERSGLVGLVAGPLDLRERHPGLGLLVGQHPARTPWLSGFEVLASPRPREDEVRAALKDLGAGGARVRTRGKSADADRWTKALRLGGGPELDVFLLRLGQRFEALVTRPLGALESGQG